MAKKKESKQKKMNVRVDFTPMVDMMMLLITFFMLCTSLAKPQAMHLTMPAKDENMQAEDKDKSKTEQTITIYLADNDKLYYYIVDKKEDFGNPEFLKETTWGKEGITSLTCHFDGQNVSSVGSMLFQTGDSSTIRIRNIYLTPCYGKWESTPVWKGECRFGNWENGFVVKAEVFENAYEGDKLEFIFNTDTDDPSITYWHIKTIYSGTSDTLKGNDYELNSYGCAYVAADATTYRIVLTGEDIIRLRETGLFVNGFHVNVTQCNLVRRVEETDDYEAQV